MITNNHSWSLGLCPNKSLEAFESPVRPRQGDHLTPENDRLVVSSRSADSPVRSGVSTCSDTLQPLTLKLQPLTVNQHKSAQISTLRPASFFVLSTTQSTTNNTHTQKSQEITSTLTLLKQQNGPGGFSELRNYPSRNWRAQGSFSKLNFEGRF